MISLNELKGKYPQTVASSQQETVIALIFWTFVSIKIPQFHLCPSSSQASMYTYIDFI